MYIPRSLVPNPDALSKENIYDIELTMDQHRPADKENSVNSDIHVFYDNENYSLPLKAE
ncbi:hypothetical protein Gbfr_045_016 [Gluconobacter frateurii M-2]|nr:hypothetical protein Gbfr_045_016 [Gluconobacter frateurii M-2]